MRQLLFFSSVAMLAATGMASAGTVTSSRIAPTVLDVPTITVQYRDCHNRTHNHYVPEWGFSAPHHHRQSDCRPIQDENDSGGYRQNYYNDDHDRPRDGFRLHFDID